LWTNTAASKKKTANKVRIPRFIQGCPLPPNETRTRSTKYVSGLNWEMTLPQPGRLLAGMKTPLTNISGNFINKVSIITSEVVSVGNADMRIPIAEKQKLATIIPRASGKK
jgi:hypothetical protein